MQLNSKIIFWQHGKKTTIRRELLIEFLEEINIRMVKVSKGNNQLVQVVDGSILKPIDKYTINRMIKEHLYAIDESPIFHVYISSDILSDILVNSIRLIDYQGALSSKNISHVPYKNGIVRVWKDKTELIKYSDFEGHIFEDEIIDRDIDLSNLNRGGIFEDFVSKLAHEDLDRFICFVSMIGYCLHDFKNKANSKAIILIDEGADGTSANGGTGKSLLFKGVGHIRKTHLENAKQLTNNQFIFQNVSENDRVLVLDDINEDFNFRQFFVTITDSLKIERKYKTPVIVPFELSPKMVITTNFVIPGLHESSSRRRRADYEVSHYFSDAHTPEDEYEMLLFDDFNEEEWLNTDCFMISCIQEFLGNGLLIPKPINLVKNLAEHQTSKEFVEFMEGNVELDQEYIKKDLFLDFTAKYPLATKRLTSNQLTRWIKNYSTSKNYEFSERKSSNNQIIELTSKDNNEKEELVNKDNNLK